MSLVKYVSSCENWAVETSEESQAAFAAVWLQFVIMNTQKQMKAHQFFLQMSGVPGSGKTTVASKIAEATGAVVIDHDITKSALLEATVPVDVAGRASYKVLQAVAKHLLRQGKSVIFDSPCLYTEVLDIGLSLASNFGTIYLYIECQTKDINEIDRRLRSRKRHQSQLAGVRVPPTDGSGKTHVDDAQFLEWMNNMKRPSSNYLLLDTSVSIQKYTNEAVDYVLGRIAQDTS